VKALRLRGVRDLQVDEVAEPGTLGSHELLLHNRLCGICGTDLHEYADGPKLVTSEAHALTGSSLPQILGHEFSGEVIAVGAEVRSAAVGDRVSVMPLFFCGECSACREGREQCCVKLGAVGYNWPWGGMGEYAVVADHQVARLPDEMTDVQGALVEPTAVALHAVTSAPVRAGDIVLVTGGGPIGQLVALCALTAGAGAVYLSEPNVRRRRHAETLGLAGVLDPADGDLVARLRDEFPGGLDIAIECAGNQRALTACIEAVRAGATVVQTALHPQPVQIDPTRLTFRDVSLKGVNCFPVTSWPRVIRLIASGRLPAQRIVTGHVGLVSAIDHGFDALLDPESEHIKILVDTATSDGLA
jgi:(R,R)-butanediol dehydrogenase/meso-butanediol dehydrogenase/diacetyl reductase